jgi:hypothetical protein
MHFYINVGFNDHLCMRRYLGACHRLNALDNKYPSAGLTLCLAPKGENRRVRSCCAGVSVLCTMYMMRYLR